MGKEQCTVHFSGTVQGVGFRYTACRVAAHHKVTGYVRNLPDARVECVVEGEAAEIEAFLADLAEAMGEYVTERTQTKAPYSGAYQSFGVRF
ncbi:MAG TPA: acylphosphatase [Phycisphaerae bacterium]|nr:acylphosphatase [Phycisphaerae bacterium]